MYALFNEPLKVAHSYMAGDNICMARCNSNQRVF